MVTQDEFVPGSWVVFRKTGNYRPFECFARQVQRVTEKLVKLTGNNWPRQIAKETALAFVASEVEANHLRDALNGAAGEYDRRTRAAQLDCSIRVGAAKDATEKKFAEIIGRRA